MYEIVSEHDGKVVGITVRDRLTKENLEAVVAFLEDRVQQHGSISLLFEMEGLLGRDAPQVLRELEMDFPSHRNVERVAIVGDETWEKWMDRLEGFFVGAEVEFYTVAHLAEAWSWVTGKV
jgi:hypothetical protein